ncbi:tape measure protein [Pelagibacterium sp. 26DY04]|uniref:tape measure protein n=1 Tax=Pelagibacterium sp. 26DY04 TaxID=2967130 RepID=UPI0028151C06|nr:tape measure protein [Pelagibacterium sp. 26DY04]WMT88656.1 tape measure protein [Pelagibacterium sp. 26DY04]
MTTERDRLLVLVEARVNDLEKGMRRATQSTQRARRDIEKEADKLSRNLETKMAKAGRGFSGVSGAFGAVRGALGMAGIGLGAGAIANLTSEWSDLNSRVANAVGSMSRGEEVMGRITEMARRSYSSLGQTAEAFLQNSTALTELGYNTTQQLNLTEALNNALVISATRGQQADSVMRAWSQALALGELRGDNLNSVIQGSSRLTKALADSMGVSTNELRKLGSEGKITTSVMYGVTSQLEQLRREADEMPATLTDSFVLLGNSVMQFFGQIDQATGATSWLAGEIILLADSIEEAARRWQEGDVPVLKFMEAAAGLSRELGILSEQVEDNREEFEILDEAVGDARQRLIEMAAELTLLENMRVFAPELPGEIQAVVDKLLLGESSAEEARLALLDLASTNPDFGLVIGQLAGVAAEIRTVTAAANEMHAALNMPGGPTGDGAGRGGAGASRRARIEAEEAAAAYLAEQDRLLGLSREQLSLEQAIAAEKERAAAAGVTLGDAEAKRLAQMRLAQSARSGGGGSSPVDRFEEAMARQRQANELLEMELTLMAQGTPYIGEATNVMDFIKTQVNA